MRFEKKDIALLIPATLLAIAGLGPDDPWVVGPCLFISWIAFVVICTIHEGSWRIRAIVAVVITIVLFGVGYRRFGSIYHATAETASKEEHKSGPQHEESKKEPVKPNDSPPSIHSGRPKKPSLVNEQINILKRDADQACKLSRDLQQAFDSKENRDREARNKFKNQPKATTPEEESNRAETIRLALQESQTKYDGDLSILGGQAFYQMKVLKPEIQSKDFTETEFDGWQFTFQEWQTNSFRNRNPVAASQYVLKVISWLPPHGLDACSPRN